MLHLPSKFTDLLKKNASKLKRNHIAFACLAVFFLSVSLIYALPQSDNENVETPADDTSTSILDNLFLFRNLRSKKNDLSFTIKDPISSSTDPEIALSNQFKYANNYNFSQLAPGDMLDFSYEITNTGTEALDIRETYYILSFVPQTANSLEFAMFGSTDMDDNSAYIGTAPLTPHSLYGEGRLYSFTSEPYTLSGSNEAIAGSPSTRRSERYMVYNRFAGNKTQGETIVIVTTLGYKAHSSDDWEPSITETVIVGGRSQPMEYRTNTDVYLSCDIAALDFINPDNPGYVTFTVTDPTGVTTSLTYDDFSSPVIGIQRAYVPFHIPDVTGDLTVTISSSDNVVCDTREIVATVVSSEENTPPDPTLNMVIPVAGPIPSFTESEKHEWVTYNAAQNVDGQWEYEKISHSASLNSSFLLMPDSNVKTAVGSTLASGYGVNAEIKSEISVINTVFDIQNVYCFFPEFDYKEYSRKLEIASQDQLTTTWQFRVNEYSHSNSRSHYIPPAYPDGLYTVHAVVRDAWTPVGELKGSLSAEVNIIGSVFDDWYITQSD